MLTSEEKSQMVGALASATHRAAEAIRSASDGWQAVAFVKSLHSSLDAVSRNWKAGDQDLECLPGCSHCCSAKVEVTDPEALYIAHHLMNIPQSQFEAVESKLRINHELRKASSEARVPCAFLEQNLCVIYEYRPSVCRKAHSLSVKACANQEVSIPQSLGLLLQHEVLMMGTNRGYEACGLSANVGELSAAVLAILDDDTKSADWYKGKPLLQSLTISSSDESSHFPLGVGKENGMEPTITSGKHFALQAKLTGSRFEDVCLGDAVFDDVNLAGAKLHNINLSDITVTAAQMGGATFKDIGPPPDQDGKQQRQRPVTFEDMTLCDSTFRKVDLSHVRIVECDTTGMTIDGIAVADLMAAYRQALK